MNYISGYAFSGQETLVSTQRSKLADKTKQMKQHSDFNVDVDRQYNKNVYTIELISDQAKKCPVESWLFKFDSAPFGASYRQTDDTIEYTVHTD